MACSKFTIWLGRAQEDLNIRRQEVWGQSRDHFNHFSESDGKLWEENRNLNFELK